MPLVLSGHFGFERRHVMLYAGVSAFLSGVSICGKAGRQRGLDNDPAVGGGTNWTGYLLALGAGVMSAVFNIGYSLALPIAETGKQMGYSSFLATNCIWVLMLGAGSIPNIVYCVLLARRNKSTQLFFAEHPLRAWQLSILMGVLWGGSIFLYGAATPLLGDLGPSIGWPLSLAVGLLTANLMGFLLREWHSAARNTIRTMLLGIGLLLVAVVFCALSTKAA